MAVVAVRGEKAWRGNVVDRGGDVGVRRECDTAELARVVEFFFRKVSGSYLSEFPCKEMSEWGSARPVDYL